MCCFNKTYIHSVQLSSPSICCLLKKKKLFCTQWNYFPHYLLFSLFRHWYFPNLMWLLLLTARVQFQFHCSAELYCNIALSFRSSSTKGGWRIKFPCLLITTFCPIVHVSGSKVWPASPGTDSVFGFRSLSWKEIKDLFYPILEKYSNKIQTKSPFRLMITCWWLFRAGKHAATV